MFQRGKREIPSINFSPSDDIPKCRSPPRTASLCALFEVGVEAQHHIMAWLERTCNDLHVDLLRMTCNAFSVKQIQFMPKQICESNKSSIASTTQV
jgi:hypothetical protein